MKNENSILGIKEAAQQLSNEANADAAAIQLIITTAIADIDAILSKYSDFPLDVSLPALSHGRNAITSLRVHVDVKASTITAPALGA